LTARAVAEGALKLGSVIVDGEDIYWAEGRPEERGRTVVVRRTADGRIEDVTPEGTNVRSRVHEYGGAAYIVSRGTVCYTEFADQRLYRLVPRGTPEPLTPPGDCFYADCAIDWRRRRILCVREDHGIAGREPVNTLVGLSLDGASSAGETLASGHDFYSTPRVSPDGSQLSWLAWRHPQMPWDGTELWVADLSSTGALEHHRHVAGSERESIFQPGWSPDGTLYFVSDRSGWWNLYRLRAGVVEAVHSMAAEFGRAQWQLGSCTWACAGPSRLVVTYVLGGRWRLATIDVGTGRFRDVPTEIEPADSVAATRTHAALVGGSVTRPDGVVRIDLSTGEAETIRATSVAAIRESEVSAPEAIEFPAAGGHTAHAFYYRPHSTQYGAPPTEHPPLIVFAHGGPTAATSARLTLEVQYWTSRGFAVVDVNYGGSAGYGRAYRERLRGQWGIVDVADCAGAARYLAASGRADSDRLIIRGRSAGGYTTLAALTRHGTAFKAGTSYYGIADLELLARETHKFESRYLDNLIGPYPEARDVYRARSPLHLVDRLESPLLLFQGQQDPVVPPNQARLMAAAARTKGLPVALMMFDGEQHGFRRAETIATCLEVELFFYAAVFGFTPAGAMPAVEIENLDAWRTRTGHAGR
jgi:dipeptidyl aminopeptidase/acylaminoacyl peptidase